MSLNNKSILILLEKFKKVCDQKKISLERGKHGKEVSFLFNFKSNRKPF